ncbi:hypothetical protein IEQ44_07510 [Nocardioides sp. Y6]|uniref:DUF429 domain-containing protein n=1 Tax=Nocardioides malaquae TaxID=2773426 RepID=A0ABR9RSI0_9ACTN|nr:hypothetical protein [Nocardioides malaquae]
MGSVSVLGRFPGGHMYVDESTAKQYLVMCAVIPTGDVNATRGAMRGLLLPGQKSLHMKNEKKRAKEILERIVALQPSVLVLACHETVPDLVARERCVQRLSREACAAGLGRVMLDPIESLRQRDLSWIHQGARAAGHTTPPFQFGHQQRHEEPLMWIADAVGWAWQRGGKHRSTVRGLVKVIEV